MDKCANCGIERAEGWAFINDVRYCHGDSIFPSCYEMVMWGVEEEITNDYLAMVFESMEED